MGKYLGEHVGELILAGFATLTLIAYTVTVMWGKADQTLGNVLMTAVGGLAALMRISRRPASSRPQRKETSDEAD